MALYSFSEVAHVHQASRHNIFSFYKNLGPMGVKKSPPVTNSSALTRAQDAFTGRTRRDIDSNLFLGPIKSWVTFFNGSMTWMQGKALVKNGSQDLFCEFGGDPNLIERRFGGSVKWSHENTTGEDPVSFNAEASPTATQKEEAQLKQDTWRSTATLVHPGLNEGPAHNTRSRAGGSLRGRGGHKRNSVTGSSWRRISTEKLTGGEGKEKVEAGHTDNLAQITARIGSFSAYMRAIGPILPIIPPKLAGGSVKNKVHAGSQVPVDTPPTQAPSSFVGVVID
ncbi:hypothetical protein VP01_4355g1 [Puccinia sorghi]|uniref:Uncharacterized protein n=1 Tax=Puccinia sorghi TaxID=27349 RepID=A0A0L6URU0_9BASI|nr:hypothetical protein VP01_4355g1 [Puccinia sorghi]